MIYIGIDPGKSGCLVAIDTEGNSPPKVWSTPLIGHEYDIDGMLSIVEECGELCAKAVIERVHAMPGQGRTSMLSIGYGAGLWHGILTCRRVPWSVVTARTWQRDMLSGIGGDDTKSKCVVAARRLFPDLDLRRTTKCKGPDHNVCDALLMAEWLRRRG